MPRRIFKEIVAKNEKVMKSLVDEIKGGKATNFVAAARGTSDHALIYFKYVLEVSTKYTLDDTLKDIADFIGRNI